MKDHVEEERTRARSAYAEKEGVERIKERRNTGRVIGGRGKMGRRRVGGKGGRMKKVNSRCKKSKFCLDPRGKGLASGGATRRPLFRLLVWFL